MESILTCSLFILVVGVDMWILRRLHPVRFRRAFVLPLWAGPVYIILLLMLAFKGAHGSVLWGALMMTLFPVFLLQRRRYYRMVDQPWPEENRDRQHALFFAADALKNVYLWWCGMAAVLFGLQVMFEIDPSLQSDLGELIVVAGTSSILTLFLIFRSVRRFPGMKFSEILALKRNGGGWLRLFLFPLLAGLIFAGLAAYATMSREVQPETPLSQVLSETQSSWLQMGFLFLAVLMAPFIEEIIFRGYIFYVIRRVAGGVAAFVIVAVIFGLMHFQQYWGDWLVIALITALGFVLTFFRLTWGTTIPGIIMHYTFNFTMTIIPVVSLFLADPFYARYQMFYQQLTDPQKEELLLKSLQKNPSHPPSNNDLAWLYARQGIHLDKALKMAETALKSAPEEFAFLDTKAEVLYRMGRFKEAIAIESVLAEKYPDNSYIAGQLQKFHDGLSGEGPP